MIATGGPAQFVANDATILVVEDQAHRPAGHYPNRFMELAEGFAAAGAHVETLTSLGWVLAAPDAAPHTIPVHRFSRPARFIYGLTLRPLRSRRLKSLGVALRCLILLGQVRRRAAHMGAPSLHVVVVGMRCPPWLFAALARHGHWLIHVFSEQQQPPSWARTLLTRRAQHTSTRHITIAVPSSDWVDIVRDALPGTEVVHLPLAGLRPTRRVVDASSQLGLPTGRPIALLFGSAHSDHDPTVVAAAMRTSDEWQLVVAGKIAFGPEWSTDDWTVRPILLPGSDEGFIDSATRSLLFEAADVVVLSFLPHYSRNSGTFMDAMAHEAPVLVSDQSAAAELTVTYGVGAVFPAGDATALRQLLDRGRVTVDSTAFGALRDALSNEAVARRHLDVIAH